MGNTQRIIMVWGVLIGLYLVLANSGGTKKALAGLTGFATGTTKVLQGRG